MNSTSAYPEPVARLLHIGDPGNTDHWLDYREYGISSREIPELIKMATDLDSFMSDSEDDEVWAPVHAWRALGQLQAVEAINPLINLFHILEDNDWIFEDMPEVFSLIGPVALPALAVYLQYPYRPLMARTVAANCITEIGRKRPEVKKECVRYLMDGLKRHAENDPELNGYLILDLLDLKAREALPLINEVYRTGDADETMATLDEVFEELEV